VIRLTDSLNCWVSMGAFSVLDDGTTLLYTGGETDATERESVTATKVVVAKEVTSISGKAFMDVPSITAVDFSKAVNLTSIGSGAFSGCSSLESLVFPPNIGSIGRGSFRGCNNLLTVDFSRCTHLTDSCIQDAFQDCVRLKEIIPPPGLEGEWENLAHLFMLGEFSSGCTEMMGLCYANDFEKQEILAYLVYADAQKKESEEKGEKKRALSAEEEDEDEAAKKKKKPTTSAGAGASSGTLTAKQIDDMSQSELFSAVRVLKASGDISKCGKKGTDMRKALKFHYCA